MDAGITGNDVTVITTRVEMERPITLGMRVRRKPTRDLNRVVIRVNSCNCLKVCLMMSNEYIGPYTILEASYKDSRHLSDDDDVLISSYGARVEPRVNSGAGTQDG